MRHFCLLRSFTTPISLLVLCALPGAGICQGLGDYAFVHPFGLSSATTTRQFGMGGTISCVLDTGAGNPAFAALHEAPNVGLRVSATDFEYGPDLLSVHLHAVQPLVPGTKGLQISLFSLHSSNGLMVLPGVGPVVFELSEEDVAVHYGQVLAPRLVGGIGVSPYSRIGFALGVPGGPTLLDVSAKPDWGARLGLAYEYAPGDFVGLVCDYYQETAKATGVALGLAPGAAIEAVFHTDLLALGVSHHLQPDLLAAVEYQRGTSSAGPIEGSLSGWHVGLEWQLCPSWALRLGANDKRPSLGFGYGDDTWQVDYAYISRWNDDIASGIFGSSDTHQVEAIYRW